MPPTIRTTFDASGNLTAIETFQGPLGWVHILSEPIQRGDVPDLIAAIGQPSASGVEAAIAQIVACTDLMDNAGSARARDALRAAIAADQARAVEAGISAAFAKLLPGRPTPDEARRLVEAFAAAHGALVLLMHGGQYDPFDDEGTRRSAADTARTALLRALGVEA